MILALLSMLVLGIGARRRRGGWASVMGGTVHGGRTLVDSDAEHGVEAAPLDGNPW